MTRIERLGETSASLAAMMQPAVPPGEKLGQYCFINDKAFCNHSIKTVGPTEMRQEAIMQTYLQQ
jgi:hypothetical protein